MEVRYYEKKKLNWINIGRKFSFLHWADQEKSKGHQLASVAPSKLIRSTVKKSQVFLMTCNL
jgi:hypothetical protein